MKKISTFFVLLALLFGPLTGAVADENEAHESGDLNVMTEMVEQSTLLLQLKQKLAQMQYRYTLFQENLEDAKEGFEEAEKAIANLKMVLASLDDQLKDNQHQVTSVKTQKERKRMEIENLEEEVQILELQLEDQKNLVGELMALLYVKRDVYYEHQNVDPVKVLASPYSVSETLQKITYLDLIEQENQVQMDKIVGLSDELSQKWGELREKKSELEDLDRELSGEKLRLQAERDAQAKLLGDLKGERAVLEAMLASSDDREEELLQEIELYEKNVQTMQEKLANMDALLTTDQKELISQIEQEIIQNFDIAESSEYLQLDWPVSPAGGLTAFFHDPGYKAAFGVEHYAVDIRIKQGSSIFAPAEGVVTEVIYDETSSKYAYIKIAHRMGAMTVYGHISAPAVAVGDFVTKKQVIGYTGGALGAVGSGAMTTGSHLHFEVWQDGVRVDPLRYLPLEDVPMDSLPEEHLDQIQEALEEQIKQIQEAMAD